MAAKLKDGLFIGDADTSFSEEFINDNKISNLVNLSGREVPNNWAAHGLVYLTFYWEDRPDFNLRLQVPGPLTSLITSNSDASLPVPNKGANRDIVSDLVEFIDVSLHHGISVLLFSTRGQCRCATAAVVYFMKKYRWSFPKTMDYIVSRKPDIQINRGFLQQLAALDKQLLLINCIPEKRQILINHLRQENSSNSNGANDSNSQSMLALIASAVLTKDDYARWKDWDSSYLHLKNKGHEIDYDRDEGIIVCSFHNSRSTLVPGRLPGPFKGAMNEPKRSVLRFDQNLTNNGNNHGYSGSSYISYDINDVRPTRGCLKGARSQQTNGASKPTQTQTVGRPASATTHASNQSMNNNNNNNNNSNSNNNNIGNSSPGYNNASQTKGVVLGGSSSVNSKKKGAEDLDFGREYERVARDDDGRADGWIREDAGAADETASLASISNNSGSNNNAISNGGNGYGQSVRSLYGFLGMEDSKEASRGVGNGSSSQDRGVNGVGVRLGDPLGKQQSSNGTNNAISSGSGNRTTLPARPSSATSQSSGPRAEYGLDGSDRDSRERSNGGRQSIGMTAEERLRSLVSNLNNNGQQQMPNSGARQQPSSPSRPSSAQGPPQAAPSRGGLQLPGYVNRTATNTNSSSTFAELEDMSVASAFTHNSATSQYSAPSLQDLANMYPTYANSNTGRMGPSGSAGQAGNRVSASPRPTPSSSQQQQQQPQQQQRGAMGRSQQFSNDDLLDPFAAFASLQIGGSSLGSGNYTEDMQGYGARGGVGSNIRGTSNNISNSRTTSAPQQDSRGPGSARMAWGESGGSGRSASPMAPQRTASAPNTTGSGIGPPMQRQAYRQGSPAPMRAPSAASQGSGLPSSGAAMNGNVPLVRGLSPQRMMNNSSSNINNNYNSLPASSGSTPRRQSNVSDVSEGNSVGSNRGADRDPYGRDMGTSGLVGPSGSRTSGTGRTVGASPLRGGTQGGTLNHIGSSGSNFSNHSNTYMQGAAGPGPSSGRGVTPTKSSWKY